MVSVSDIETIADLLTAINTGACTHTHMHARMHTHTHTHTHSVQKDQLHSYPPSPLTTDRKMLVNRTAADGEWLGERTDFSVTFRG